MKQEYMKKLKLAKKLLVWDTTLPNDVLDSNVDKGCDLLEELVTIQDTDVLVGLLDFFTDENEDYGGVCERLDNDIWDNYEPSQIIDALRKDKFKYLLNNDLLRACTMAIAIINTGHGEELREIFNAQRSDKSAKFVEDLYSWGKYGNYEEYAALLREDMRKW